MDNFSFTSWTQYKGQTQPAEGFNQSSDYTAPTSETEVRNQLQSLHSQTKAFINNSLVAGANSMDSRLTIAESEIDGLQANEITSITGDDTIGVTKSGSTYAISLITSPTGVTKAYVDAEVDGAKEYTDAKLAITTGTLPKNTTSITLSDERITTNSILSFYTSVYGVSPTAVSVSAGSVTLTFNSRSSAMTVGVSVDG